MMDAEIGKMTGFYMDITNSVAERAGFEINLITMEFVSIIGSSTFYHVDLV